MGANDSAVYARVVDGVVVEYPIHLQTITARGQPLEWFTPVQTGIPPTATEYQTVVGTPVVFGSAVVLQYAVKDISLDRLLSRAWTGNDNNLAMRRRNDLPVFDVYLNNLPTPVIKDLDPILVDKIFSLISINIDIRLDKFAASKKYSSIDKACGFINSNEAEWVSDAKVAIYNRDITWKAYIKYVNDVTNGTIALAKQYSDIETMLPELSWDIKE